MKKFKQNFPPFTFFPSSSSFPSPFPPLFPPHLFPFSSSSFPSPPPFAFFFFFSYSSSSSPYFLSFSNMFRHDSRQERTSSFMGEENFLFQTLPNPKAEGRFYFWLKSFFCLPCYRENRINDLENLRISIQKPTLFPKLSSQPYKKFQTFTERKKFPIRSLFILQHKSFTFLAINYPVAPSLSSSFSSINHILPPSSLSPSCPPHPPSLSPFPSTTSFNPLLPTPDNSTSSIRSPPPPLDPPPPPLTSPPPPSLPPPVSTPDTTTRKTIRAHPANGSLIPIEELMITITSRFSLILFYDLSMSEPQLLEKLSEKSFVIRLRLQQYISKKFTSSPSSSTPPPSVVPPPPSSLSPSFIYHPPLSNNSLMSTLPSFSPISPIPTSPPLIPLPSPYSSLPPLSSHPLSSSVLPPSSPVPFSPSLDCFPSFPIHPLSIHPFIPPSSNFDTILVDKHFLKTNGPRTISSLAILDFWGLELSKVGGPIKGRKFFQKMIGNALKKSSNLLVMFREDVDVTWMAEIFEKVVNSLSLEPPSLSLSLYLPSTPSPSPFLIFYSPHSLSHAKRETDFLLSHLPKGPQLLSELGSAYLKRVLWNSWSVGGEEGFLEGVGRRVLESWGQHEEVRKWGNQMG